FSNAASSMTAKPRLPSPGTIFAASALQTKDIAHPASASASASTRQRRTWPPPIITDASVRKIALRGSAMLQPYRKTTPLVMLLSHRHDRHTADGIGNRRASELACG